MTIKIADHFAARLDRAGLREAFEEMPPSHQREYVSWIEEAKKESTRQGRIKSALDMIRDWAEARGRVKRGKSPNGRKAAKPAKK